FRNIELDEGSTKNREHIHQIFNAMRENGGSIVALTLRLNLLGGDVKSDEKYFNEVKNWIRFCGENGCRILKLKATPEKSREYIEKDFSLLYRNLLNLLSAAEKNNVKISIDIEESAYLKMERLMSMIEDIGSENIGLTLKINDVKNISEAALEKLVPLVNHVVISQNSLNNPEKDFLRKVFHTLNLVFYSGYVSIEFTNIKSIEDLSNCVKKLEEIISDRA
ncbi:MAG: sugar phosphate isomerase/epimerase, partial [Crenarchaeota archaeon]|nr:sugar phosphate isomerase/epimerase [Thermoproteota archaeon]MDW8034780.1 TIM barrel protein [Nitrososphaerota archaeon]